MIKATLTTEQLQALRSDIDGDDASVTVERAVSALRAMQGLLAAGRNNPTNLDQCAPEDLAQLLKLVADQAQRGEARTAVLEQEVYGLRLALKTSEK